MLAEKNEIVKEITQVTDDDLPVTVILSKDCLYRMYSTDEVDLYPELAFVADNSKKIAIEEHKKYKERDENLGCYLCKDVIRSDEESYTHCNKFRSHKKCFLQILKNQTNGKVFVWEDIKKKRCPGCYKILTNKEIISADLLDHNTTIELMTALKKRKAIQHEKRLYHELMNNKSEDVFLPCCLMSSTLNKAIKHMNCIAEFSDNLCTLNNNCR